jgi:bifunctional enzyme CysN/CysC
VAATVQPPKYSLDVNSLERLAATTFEMNEIGVANLWTDRPLVFTPFEENKELGGFILIDKISNATVAAGLIHFALRRSQNVHSQKLQVTPAARAAIKGQQPKLLWFTGLSGAGKSTIADLVEQKLHALGHHTFLLDGDNLRLGLTKDLGFTDADRIENIRRVAEAAKLMTDAGLIVLAALISPFRADREMVRSMFPEGDFIEIFVDTPLAEAERRDAKGLYKKARAGLLLNFTGIDAPYEPPEDPEIRISTMDQSAEAAAEAIVHYLLERSGRPPAA